MIRPATKRQIQLMNENKIAYKPCITSKEAALILMHFYARKDFREMSDHAKKRMLPGSEYAQDPAARLSAILKKERK